MQLSFKLCINIFSVSSSINYSIFASNDAIQFCCNVRTTYKLTKQTKQKNTRNRKFEITQREKLRLGEAPQMNIGIDGHRKPHLGIWKANNCTRFQELDCTVFLEHSNRLLIWFWVMPNQHGTSADDTHATSWAKLCINITYLSNRSQIEKWFHLGWEQKRNGL